MLYFISMVYRWASPHRFYLLALHDCRLQAIDHHYYYVPFIYGCVRRINSRTTNILQLLFENSMEHSIRKPQNVHPQHIVRCRIGSIIVCRQKCVQYECSNAWACPAASVCPSKLCFRMSDLFAAEGSSRCVCLCVCRRHSISARSSSETR